MIEILVATKTDLNEIISLYPRLEGMVFENNNSSYTLIVKNDQKIVGCASIKRRIFKLPTVKWQDDFIFVIDIFEDVNKRKGYGTLLINKIKMIARKNNSDQVSAMSSICNYNVQAFWLKQGFVNIPILTIDGNCNETLVGYKINKEEKE